MQHLLVPLGAASLPMLRGVLDDSAASNASGALKKVLSYKAVELSMGSLHNNGAVTQALAAHHDVLNSFSSAAGRAISPGQAVALLRRHGEHSLASRLLVALRHRNAIAHPDRTLLGEVLSFLRGAELASDDVRPRTQPGSTASSADSGGFDPWAKAARRLAPRAEPGRRTCASLGSGSARAEATHSRPDAQMRQHFAQLEASILVIGEKIGDVQEQFQSLGVSIQSICANIGSSFDEQVQQRSTQLDASMQNIGEKVGDTIDAHMHEQFTLLVASIKSVGDKIESRLEARVHEHSKTPGMMQSISDKIEALAHAPLDSHGPPHAGHRRRRGDASAAPRSAGASWHDPGW